MPKQTMCTVLILAEHCAGCAAVMPYRGQRVASMERPAARMIRVWRAQTVNAAIYLDIDVNKLYCLEMFCLILCVAVGKRYC